MERRQGVAAERTNFSERIADIGSDFREEGRDWREGDSVVIR